jgi:hypothetical protein
MTKSGWQIMIKILFGLLLLCIQMPASATIILSFDPINGKQRLGETLFVDINANFTGGDSIIAFGLDVNFNPSLIETVSATLNTSIFPDPQLPPDFSNDGVITFTGFVPLQDPPLSGSFTLATMEFLLIDTGLSPLTISFTGPTQGFGLDSGEVVVPELSNVGTATISAVPEPNSLSLLLFFMFICLFNGYWRRSIING